jgi:hypothetical protein
MELCTKRDMTDAARLISNFDIAPDLLHDLAQAIANGRRPSQAKADYLDKVVKSGSL